MTTDSLTDVTSLLRVHLCTECRKYIISIRTANTSGWNIVDAADLCLFGSDLN
jgi:hypothetical protein